MNIHFSSVQFSLVELRGLYLKQATGDDFRFSSIRFVRSLRVFRINAVASSIDFTCNKTGKPY